ncbi:MAG: methylated-DNA--[protein]-cysteine S-methyltransferase [Pegethrix bostrychoides GSE-TBD4-15B]|jgi:methylated-DNA-[protein]-cysteine S-methyltransferase|uniref:Methylated-DNA--protein-cysteine methyltransferase n=1 Tax=Pegethrix bostrychoides GSE-TBD4-15B TaxID=2839662 RepID=A0A951PBA6_9CYAN|nr:methylated-DNA--[protein]-cysteine S-methyltransferase [Pegethrix bostrychoides GSE-TBD4-15B]
MKTLTLEKLSSPIGRILVITDDQTLYGVEFEGYEARTYKFLAKRFGDYQLNIYQNSTKISQHIQAYLEGDYHSLDQIPVSTSGTAFQQQVWTALRQIPVGTVMTYGELARQLNKPAAARAVGITNSLNPISIVLPCHRVIGANGTLTGYAGGLERKRWLLQHEGWQPDQQLNLLTQSVNALTR